MTRSSAHFLAVVLIDRVASRATRFSAPTWSTPGSPWRKRFSEASDATTSSNGPAVSPEVMWSTIPPGVSGRPGRRDLRDWALAASCRAQSPNLDRATLTRLMTWGTYTALQSSISSGDTDLPGADGDFLG